MRVEEHIEQMRRCGVKIKEDATGIWTVRACRRKVVAKDLQAALLVMEGTLYDDAIELATARAALGAEQYP